MTDIHEAIRAAARRIAERWTADLHAGKYIEEEITTHLQPFIERLDLSGWPSSDKYREQLEKEQGVRSVSLEAMKEARIVLAAIALSDCEHGGIGKANGLLRIAYEAVKALGQG